MDQEAKEVHQENYQGNQDLGQENQCDGLDPLSALDDPTAKRMREGSEAVAPSNR